MRTLDTLCEAFVNSKTCMYESISICVVSTSQELCGYFYVACGDGSGAAPRMENYEFTYFIDFFTKSLSFSSLQTMSALHSAHGLYRILRKSTFVSNWI